MLTLGDPHNFGQRVHRIERASGGFFQKPRSVFWEWLFFGMDSPLRDILGEPGNRGAETPTSDLIAPIFGLEIEFDDAARGGVSKAVAPATDCLPRDQEMVRFGSLLAYCYALGIRDLHRGNLVPTERGLQVVDAEVVLANLTLPNETLLLPFKDVTFNRSGIGHLFQERQEITSSDALNVLHGFTAMLVLIDSKSDALRAEIERGLAVQAYAPIRHIIRDTAKYRTWLAEGAPEDALLAESEQLSRGDIPYFFKFIGSQELHYYVDESSASAHVIVPEALRRAVDREAVRPKALLNRQRIREELFPNGCLFLARHLFSSADDGTVDMAGNIRIQLSANTIAVTSRWGTFESARVRAKS